MTSLAQILGWKFNHAPGIRTRVNDQGIGEIFDWPISLGPKPTKIQIDQWKIDFNDANLDKPEPSKSNIIEELLIDKGIITNQDIIDKRNQIRGR